MYSNVEGLEIAGPVEINGFSIGSIQSININETDVKTMVVRFEVEGNYLFPKDTKAVLSTSNSLVGSKKIILEFDELCQTNCLQSGDQMISDTRGILETILPKEDLRDHLSVFREEIKGIMDSVIVSVSNDEADNSLSNSLAQMEKTMTNMASLTETMDRFMKSSYKDLDATIANMASITETLEGSNDNLQNIMANVSEFTRQIADADVGKTLGKTDETFERTNTILADLETTMEEANSSFEKLNDILVKVGEGEGTISKLINNEAMYENLEETSRNLSLLFQDMRLNPKRYVRLSVFGRKGKDYTYPEGDPAFDAEVLKMKKKDDSTQ